MIDTIIITFLTIVMVSLIVLLIKDIRNHLRKPKRWTIVVNNEGRWSFITFSGNPDERDWPSREDAEKERDKTIAWSEEWDRGRLDGSHDRQRKMKELRNQSFKPADQP